MTKETFIKILDLQSEHYKKEQQLHKLGIDTLEFNETIISVVELLWSEVLTECGLDWLSWFMFEKSYISGELREDIKAWDGEIDIIRDINELYDYLAENKYFKC